MKPSTRARLLWLGCLGLVFAFAIVARIHHISDPPLDFHPTLQFRAALLARHYYFRQSPSVPQWRRELAARNASERYEFPLMQYSAAIAYRLSGGEDLRIPRLMSVAAWLVGGVLLFAAARKISSPTGALIATSFFLLCPFGVSASRAFYPDALMVALLVLSYLVLLHYGERGGLALAILAGAVGGASGLVKPKVIVQVAFGFAAVWLARRGYRKRNEVVQFAAFVIVAAGIAFPYYVLEALRTGILGGVAEQSFVPRLLLTAAFWRGWIDQIWKVVGFAPPLAALLGFLALPRGSAKALLAGLASGFFAYGVLFSYPIFTHDYYNLQLVPLVALAMAPLAARIFDRLREGSLVPGLATPAVLAVLLLGAVVHLAADSYYQRWGTSFTAEAETYRRVGELVNHGADNVLLANYYAYPLKYYGEVGGTYWPHSFDFWQGRLKGSEPQAAAERLRSMCKEGNFRFFIVTNLPELHLQPELEGLLAQSYAVFAAERDFIIYDLRAPRNAAGS